MASDEAIASKEPKKLNYSGKLEAISTAISNVNRPPPSNIYAIIAKNMQFLSEAGDLGYNTIKLILEALEKIATIEEKVLSDQIENMNKNNEKSTKYDELKNAIYNIDRLINKYNSDPNFKTSKELYNKALNGELKEKEINELAKKAVDRNRSEGENTDLTTLNIDIKTVKEHHERSINRIHKLVKGHGDEPDEKNKSDIHNEIKFHLAVVKSTHHKLCEAETLSLHLEPAKTVEEFLKTLGNEKENRANRKEALKEVGKKLTELQARELVKGLSKDIKVEKINTTDTIAPDDIPPGTNNGKNKSHNR